MNLAQMFGGAGPQEDVIGSVAIYALLSSRLVSAAEAYTLALKDDTLTAEEKAQVGGVFAGTYMLLDSIVSGKPFQVIMANLNDMFSTEQMAALGKLAQSAKTIHNRLFSETVMEEKSNRWKAFFDSVSNEEDDGSSDVAAIASLQN